MAGQIPTQFIDELLTRIDIVDIIDARVPLKKAGKNLHACCPFHNEKTPSFTVSPDKQFYHCFGCGAHGTAIGFLMEYEQMSFPEAIEELAQQAGLTVPAQTSSVRTAQSQSLYTLLDKVSQYYIHQLHTHPQRERFLRYLEQRGVSTQTREYFQIGMAPDGWDNVLSTFGHDANAKKMLADAGLLSSNDRGRSYDRFRNRLMFPIHDRRGRVVGFGGRVLDDSTPKYLNSPETPVFHKGRELYGLYQARKANRRLERILIVEGYMDVVALAEHGISNAVATLGTATTSEHLQQLLRSAPEVIFCFDGDRAGREAAWRAAENALPMLGGNHQLKFMFLPEGEDPDSLVRAQGVSYFEQQIKSAMPFSDFFFSTLEKPLDLSSMDGRAQLVEKAKPYLRRIPQGIYRDMMEARLAEKTHTQSTLLHKHLALPTQTRKAGKKRADPIVSFSPVRMAITILLQHPQLRAELPDYPTLRSLEMPGMDVLVQILETLRMHPHLNTATLLERARGSQYETHLQKLAFHPLSLSGEALLPELKGILQRLQQEAQEKRYQYLEHKGLRNLTEAEREEYKQFHQSH